MKGCITLPGKQPWPAAEGRGNMELVMEGTYNNQLQPHTQMGNKDCNDCFSSLFYICVYMYQIYIL